MIRPIRVLVVVVAAVAATSVHARQTPPSIDKVLADAVAPKDVAGVVAIATDRRGVIYQGAFGVADVSTGRPMTVDTIFRIASMTKPITSVALMQLVEQGKVSLDDPAEKYLPELASLQVFESFDNSTGAYRVRPAKAKPTVRHLLTHTSGLGYTFTSPIVRDFKPRAGEQYTAGPLLFEPGADWMYGTSTDWVGRLVEVISGKSLEDYFQEQILRPLKMTDTSYNVADTKLGRVVAAHRRQADGSFVVDRNVAPVTGLTRFNGGGGLTSTANDYIRFVRAVLDSGTLDGARILRADTVAQMARSHIGRVGVRAVKTAMPERSSDFSFVNDGHDKWGLGFQITAASVPGKRSAGTLSWGGINNTYFWIDPARGIGGVILMQFLPFADTKALALYDAFERAVYRHAGTATAGNVPRFRADPSWPKIPNNWQFGQVASVAIDGQDHVWILQRPGTLEAAEKARAAPPLLEFDAAGTFIRAWGGPGQGYDWPSSEHGVYVDPKGFVWIGGNGDTDHQILKFTRDGTFVMQIGRPGQSKGNADTQNLNQPADAFVHAKTNELFVADGYGNRRIIVFDADTGRFKRMWGAFGNAPTDAPPNPANADEGERGAPQFVQPVHAARVSSDGLVYVSDRGGKRVQVFTIEGTFVSQVFIGRECRAPECGNGTTAASTAFSTDPAQRYLFVGNRSQARVMVFDRRTLQLLDSFGRWGSAPGEFGTLHHMAADSKGNLYVTEVTPLRPENRRVQKFQLVP